MWHGIGSCGTPCKPVRNSGGSMNPAENRRLFQTSSVVGLDKTAETVARMGWKGIECPVRPGGHVLPKRVEEDRPRTVETLNKTSRF